MSKFSLHSKKPEVSIIIVSFSTRELTLNCLRSLARDQRLPPTEVIVIDNGSTDGSAGAIRDEYPEITLIENSVNRGFSVANNQGLAVAKGRFVLFLNTDTIVPVGAVGKMVRFLDKCPEVGIVGSRLLNRDGTVQGSCFHSPGLLNAVRASWLGQKELSRKYVPRGTKPALVEAVVAAAMMIRFSLARRLGGFDEKFFFYFEDLDLCRRVRGLGWEVTYFPGAEITHLHGTSGSAGQRFSYLKESILYPIKMLTGRWHPKTTQGYLLESSIRYHGWIKHILISVVMKFSPAAR